jgi:hypothetical protein
VGVDDAGRAVGWNLVDGIHDDPTASERSIWTAGRAAHTGPVRFAPDLSGVRSTAGAAADGVDLAFVPEATRERSENLVLLRSSYEQPFGTFTGTLPGGVRLAEGFGVMERHVAVW